VKHKRWVTAVAVILAIVAVGVWWLNNKELKIIMPEVTSTNLVPIRKAESKTYTLIATGDIILGRVVNAQMVEKNNFTYPFEKTGEMLKQGDITFVNFEDPLVAGCEPIRKGMSFCGDPRGIEGLKLAGVDVANVANNHFGNRGLPGIAETVKLFKANGIAITGNGEAPIVAVGSKKFGFLGYNDIGAAEPGIEWAKEEKIRQDVSELKQKTDWVVVAFHWGTEYVATPTVRQRQLAHAAIDAGADLIIGNHPHWVQLTEWYKGKFIAYAHGNFVFDQMWSQETREGVVGKYTFNDQGLAQVEFFPVIIEDYWQPRWANPDEGKRILNRMGLNEGVIRPAK
jgi:poly-gamma-glutamate capsule biosynthesis protein CapA/YwtB (metallophosphatase superfamily)